MTKRASDYIKSFKTNARGGEGTIEFRELLEERDLMGKGRLYSLIVLPEGTSIGKHVHEKESETFYVLSGKAEYYDNGETVTLSVGDTAHLFPGQEHSIKNIGSGDLIVSALILFE